MATVGVKGLTVCSIIKQGVIIYGTNKTTTVKQPLSSSHTGIVGPTLAVLPRRGEQAPDVVSLKSVTDGSETRICGAPGGSRDAGRRLPRRADDCLPPPTPCCLANVSSAACSACQTSHGDELPY